MLKTTRRSKKGFRSNTNKKLLNKKTKVNKKSKLAKKKSKKNKKSKKKNKKHTIRQKGRGKYLSLMPSEYYSIKHAVPYKLESTLNAFKGIEAPVNPDPTKQNLQYAKFDISPPESLLSK